MQSDVLRPLKAVVRLLLISGIGVATVFLLSKAFDEYRRSTDRGRLVASIVHQQHEALARGAAAPIKAFNTSSQVSRNSNALVVSAISDADDFALQRWMVSLSRNHTPLQIRNELDSIQNFDSYSLEAQRALLRWKEAMRRWDASEENMGTGAVAPELMIHRARNIYFEAAGYKKIGRAYDATALYLWVESLLSRYIQIAPQSDDVPEALFILGEVHLRLRHVLPAPSRGNRILNLCMELYPDSIWAYKAQTLWREEVGRLEQNEV